MSRRIHIAYLLLIVLFVGCQPAQTSTPAPTPTVAAVNEVLVTTQEGISFAMSGDEVLAVPPGEASYQAFGDYYEVSVINIEGDSPAEFHLYLDPDLEADTYVDQVEHCPEVLTDFDGMFCYTLFLEDFDPGTPVSSELDLQSTGEVLTGSLEMMLEQSPREVEINLVLDAVTLQSS